MFTIQIMGPNHNFQTYEEGDAPKLENEVAFSRQVIEANEWKIGDTVSAISENKKKEFLITGIYTDYMQLGGSGRLNPVINMDNETMNLQWRGMIDMNTSLSQEEMVKKMEKDFPEYTWTTAYKIINSNVGGIKESVERFQNPMTLLLCSVIMLITILMEKLFIAREKNEIAMMKSIGFKNRDIRKWQMIRMIWVVFIAMIAVIPLSLLSNQILLTPVFAVLGAELEIQVDFLQAYVIYLGILLIGILIATVLATHSVRKIDIREMSGTE